MSSGNAAMPGIGVYGFSISMSRARAAPSAQHTPVAFTTFVLLGE